MDDLNTSNHEAISKNITDGRKNITLIARPIDSSRQIWELTIQGKENQFTTWSECFPSSKAAMEVGMKAILEEGIDEFYSNVEFEYQL